MQISITTRHFEVDTAAKKYLAEKIKKLERYYKKLIAARAILVKEGYRHIAEIILTANNMRLSAKEASEDLHAAVDIAVGKLQKQLVHFRDKTKEHKAKKIKERLRQERLKMLGK